MFYYAKQQQLAGGGRGVDGGDQSKLQIGKNGK